MGILALIPARGGSKGIKRKNLATINGLPLVAYPILTALQSKYITRVIVSTDDAEIAQVAKKFGAEVPFIRPVEYATDTATDLPVFKHCLEWIAANEGVTQNLVVQLRPTVPLRDSRMIDKAIEYMLSQPDATSLRSVSGPEFSPYKMWEIDDESTLQPLLNLPGVKDFYDQPRQALPVVYAQDGYVDIVRTNTVLKDSSMAGKKILAFTDHGIAYDIDEIYQLERLQRLVDTNYADLKSRTVYGSLNFGIIQGRLSQTPPEVLQKFPDNWKEEFFLAKELGLKYIELLVEREFNPNNPIYSPQGLAEIKSVSEQTGVGVNSVCIDTFIQQDFEEGFHKLIELIPSFAAIGVRRLIIPFFESSELNNVSIQRYKEPLLNCANIAREFGVEICIESSLKADELISFLDDLKNSNVKVCYDTGNSTFFGHDVAGDVVKLGSRITHVHIKDRTFSGENVLLGDGNAEIRNAISLLWNLNYKGGFTFETTRGANPVLTASNHKRLLESMLQDILYEGSVLI
ncbi:hypothetical protein CN568_24140 [Bacillus pseudomycoides]|uniref:cytidylyltransferase domain-containing protein n=1 Tax=Bacillus pseudomycoides TaxID=64104 RepID=UPI000BEF52C6|nr:TIM barrel protein [Bacillus pseudomycoides]PEK39637.1 hypothetical protein CN691_02575 [Bacillus pseudomycoides]PEK66400.1 hypothetical protein CN593_18180 [Bacillus pseudomycoides]PEP38730.1 hypothetical protein CN568_24140 [Bacillus pseudomycoides]PEP40651.1 hypothetical protein CN565_16265 [Bacillus pseudomycoides]PFX44327.1 hypothetical protein COL31_26970 [Bacillus pseudomycoides]